MANDPGLISGIPFDTASTITVQQPATLQAEMSGSTCTATQDFAFMWNGIVVNFWAGETTAVDAKLLAALQAQSAPITTP